MMVKPPCSCCSLPPPLSLHVAQGVDFVLLAADPQPLRPSFFSDRIEGITAEVSKQLFDALKGGGFLDAHGYLVENPRWPACTRGLCSIVRRIMCEEVWTRCWRAGESPRRHRHMIGTIMCRNLLWTFSTADDDLAGDGDVGVESQGLPCTMCLPQAILRCSTWAARLNVSTRCGMQEVRPAVAAAAAE